jgi:RNA polymerase sigma factor (sigma-70 family)
MTPSSLPSAPADDASLVAQSLAGDRSAFGRIVVRYQALICSLAFSATGSLSRSEDLAQETFLTAWKSLRDLRDPAKLRAWLCGIARHSILGEFRRFRREPVSSAAPLEGALNLPAADPLPAASAISSEEAALLWREVGQLPAIYREALVLFYRENQSVARVAEDLEITEDAVLQRLSRGRKLLHERMLTFVEDALARTTPGRHFTLGVEAALPVLAVSAQAATATTAAKSVAATKGGGLLTIFSWIFAPFILGVVGGLVTTWNSIHTAPAKSRERRYLVKWMAALWTCVAGVNVGLAVLGGLSAANHWSYTIYTDAAVALWWLYAMALATLFVLIHRHLDAFRQEDAAAGLPPPPVPSTKSVVLEVSGIYLANFCWFVWIAWLMGDHLLAGFLVLAATALGLWHFQRLHGRPPSAYRGALPLAVACGLILLVLNLRLEGWLATIYHVTPAEMSALLPPSSVHLLTFVVLLYTALLISFTRPNHVKAA